MPRPGSLYSEIKPPYVSEDTDANQVFFSTLYLLSFNLVQAKDETIRELRSYISRLESQIIELNLKVAQGAEK